MFQMNLLHPFLFEPLRNNCYWIVCSFYYFDMDLYWEVLDCHENFRIFQDLCLLNWKIIKKKWTSLHPSAVLYDLLDKCNIIGRRCLRTGCWERHLDLGRVEEIAWWGTTWFVLLTVNCFDIGFKENGGTCIMCGVDEKCIQNFCCEIYRKEILFSM
jgi:hypothetical protein